ncbi:hypothetical protein RZS08_30495, partial [Arthrospira platensis SPKY1]|nr:hypothetical protein [Arthrospira platensis SPKY1]
MKGQLIAALIACVALSLSYIPALGQTIATGGGEYSRSSFTLMQYKGKHGTNLNFRSFSTSDSPFTSRFDWNNLSDYWVELDQFPGS